MGIRSGAAFRNPGLSSVEYILVESILDRLQIYRMINAEIKVENAGCTPCLAAALATPSCRLPINGSTDRSIDRSVATPTPIYRRVCFYAAENR